MDVVAEANAELVECFKTIDGHVSRDQILVNCLAGRYDYAEAAKLLGVDTGSVFEYMKAAVTGFDDRGIMLASDVELVDILRRLVIHVKRRVDDWIGVPVTAKNYKVVTQLVGALRGLIKDTIDLNKTLKDSAGIEIEQLNVYLTSMESFLMTDLCEECQIKALEHMKGDARKQIEAIEVVYKETDVVEQQV